MRRTLLLITAVSIVSLSACAPDTPGQAASAAGSQQEQVAKASAVLTAPRCLFLAANGAQTDIPKSIVESEEYKVCMDRGTREPMTDSAFRAAVAAMYPMEKIEGSPNYNCSDRNGDESCAVLDKWGTADGYTHLTFSPQGEVKSVGITWRGHAMGHKLLKLFGSPVGKPIQTAGGFNYFYQAQDYPYLIVHIGGAKTRVTMTFEL
jgi:hypothetical protein